MSSETYIVWTCDSCGRIEKSPGVHDHIPYRRGTDEQ